MDNTEKRIKDLEKSVKRMRAAFLLLLTVALAGGLMAAAGDNVKDVIRCRELVMVGPDGNTFATLAKGQVRGNPAE